MRKGGLSYLGEVKSTGLSAGSTPGGHADGAAGPDEGAVDLPGPETGTQAPDMLDRGAETQNTQNNRKLTLKARQAKFMAAQKARKGAKSVVRRR